MCLVSTLKFATKAALRSGKIHNIGWRIHDPTNVCPEGNHLYTTWANFEHYNRPLSDQEWMSFQAQEREFRKTLDVKLINDRQTIRFIGNNPRHWTKLITILCGVYYRNGSYTATHRDGRPLGIPLLKYTVRILRKFPLCRALSPRPDSETLTEWIDQQLRYVRETIQPALNRATNSSSVREPRVVSEKELAYLWEHRRSKEIDIILNSSTYPDPPPPPPSAISDVDKVYEYYTAKCQPAQLHQQTSSPPWCGALDLDKPKDLPATSDFTTEEISRVLCSLPNNKSCSADGVTYEVLKATKQFSIVALTQIFNVCLINRKVPDSWKGAII